MFQLTLYFISEKCRGIIFCLDVIRLWAWLWSGYGRIESVIFTCSEYCCLNTFFLVLTMDCRLTWILHLSALRSNNFNWSCVDYFTQGSVSKYLSINESELEDTKILYMSLHDLNFLLSLLLSPFCPHTSCIYLQCNVTGELFLYFYQYLQRTGKDNINST
jgi:hypothetical protein